jgi:hypothetical protein
MTNSALGHVMPNLFFCIQWDPHVMFCNLVRPRRETSTHYFSYSGGISTDMRKMCSRKCYVKHVFLHPVGSPSHIAHSGASGARNIDTLYSNSGGTGKDMRKSALGEVTPNLCFRIRWDLRVTLCTPMHPRREMSSHRFYARVSPVQFP